MKADLQDLIACSSHNHTRLAQLNGCVQRNKRFLATNMAQPIVNLENDGEIPALGGNGDMEIDFERDEQLRGADLDHDGMKTHLLSTLRLVY